MGAMGAGPLGVWIVAAWGLAGPAPQQPPDRPPDPPAVELSAGLETRRDRFAYRFENDSSFDTTGLVPHFFRQSYVADNPWLTVRAAFPVGRQRWTAAVAFTPETVTFGDDFDTFFQPDGDVVTSGTAGDVSLRSWRASLRFVDTGGQGAAFRLRYEYRRDRSRFHPADRVVTHARPPSETREFITTRETTVSETHEILIGLALARPIGRRWRVDAGVEIAPTAIARLTTRLPDKYPGRDIVFSAIAASARVQGSLAVTGDWWFAEVAGDAGRAWSWLSDRRFTREGLGASVRVGVRR